MFFRSSATALCLFLCITACAGSAFAISSPVFSARFDSEIKAAAERWWPDYPHWLSLKAQLFQESKLDPAAVSPVGARGLGQFMPGTWADVSKALGWKNVSPHSAPHSIIAAAFYMRQLRRFPDWRETPDPDRHQLAQAAYNAGAGNIRKAERRCGMASTYSGIIACLADVTGRANARQSTEYVDRIARWRALMEAGK